MFAVLLLIFSIAIIILGYVKPETVPVVPVIGFILILFYIIRPLIN